jgi:hypothetical protein
MVAGWRWPWLVVMAVAGAMVVGAVVRLTGWSLSELDQGASVGGLIVGLAGLALSLVQRDRTPSPTRVLAARNPLAELPRLDRDDPHMAVHHLGVHPAIPLSPGKTEESGLDPDSPTWVERGPQPAEHVQAVREQRPPSTVHGGRERPLLPDRGLRGHWPLPDESSPWPSPAASHPDGRRGVGTPGGPATRPHRPRARSTPRSPPRRPAVCVPRKCLEGCQQFSYRHLTQRSVPSAECGLELSGNCSISPTERDGTTGLVGCWIRRPPKPAPLPASMALTETPASRRTPAAVRGGKGRPSARAASLASSAALPVPTR